MYFTFFGWEVLTEEDGSSYSLKCWKDEDGTYVVVVFNTRLHVCRIKKSLEWARQQKNE